MYQEKVLIFGAGASGRGHLGELLYRDGKRNLVFVDKKSKLVETLNASKGYSVRLLTGTDEPEHTSYITNVIAVHRSDEERIIREFCESSLVLTAVIAENLPDISQIIAKCIKERISLKIEIEMNIICCENLDHASSWLKEMVYEKLTKEEIDYCEYFIGFPDAMISRVVPIPPEGEVSIVTEDYSEWTVDWLAFSGKYPNIPSMEIVKNLSARLERKLWIHNGGHAALAYAAYLKGYHYIHEALKDDELASFTGAVLNEIGNCIVNKYSDEFTEEEIRLYEADLGRRGAIEEIKDDISRVTRDPLRKLQINDRLIAPAVFAQTNNLPYQNLIKAIVNATYYYSEGDKESVEMQEIIKEKGYRYFVKETLGLQEYPVLAEGIIACQAEYAKGVK